MLAQLLGVAQQLGRSLRRSRPGEGHGAIAAPVALEQHLRAGAGQAVILIRVAVGRHAARHGGEMTKQPRPEIDALDEPAALELHRHDFAEVAAFQS